LVKGRKKMGFIYNKIKGIEERGTCDRKTLLAVLKNGCADKPAEKTPLADLL
jgi:hypothetical protein